MLPKNRALVAIGLMSGTSFDGIDAAMVKTDGQTIQALNETYHLPYTPELRQKIRALLREEINVKLLLDVENELSQEHVFVVLELLKKAKLESKDIDLLGFHGQTIYHDPEHGHSLQIGNPSLLAALTSIDVIGDFRRKDMVLGGQGAPLVPLFHEALFETLEKPIAIVNIGGVANITYLGSDGKITAFDCGPGMALVDDLMHRITKKAFDDEGNFGRTGKVDERALEIFREKSFFAKPPPKSLDRNAFANLVRDLIMYVKLRPEDAVATATCFTAEGIIQSVKFLPNTPKNWIISGGGRHNKFLLNLLKDRYSLNIIEVDQVKMSFGKVDGDFIEAQAFGFLAVRSYYNMPLSFPMTTGASSPASGGALYRF